MDSTYDENDFMPSNTGERTPSPEPDEKPRVLTSRDKSQPSTTNDHIGPKRAVRRAARAPRIVGVRKEPRRKDKQAQTETRKLTILLDPVLLTTFKIHALTIEKTFSQLATDAFIAYLDKRQPGVASPPKKKIFQPDSPPN